MKSILVILVFILLNFSGFAQQIINVFDGFTLEPIDTFDIDIISGKMEVKRISGSTFEITKLKNGTIILLTNPKYGYRKIVLSNKNKSVENFILTPNLRLLSDYHSAYPYYSNLTKTDSVFNLVDVPAEFPEGIDALKRYLVQTIIYPQKCAEYGIVGKIFIQFIVEIDGSISNVWVLNGVNKLMDEECVRVAYNMPHWKPGEINGKPVRSIFSLPVSFKLE